MQSWIQELRQLGPPNLVLAIAGNKLDISEARQVWRQGEEGGRKEGEKGGRERGRGERGSSQICHVPNEWTSVVPDICCAICICTTCVGH